MKIQIKRDEVSKDTKNHLKFKKKLRKMLMQRERNRDREYVIDNAIAEFDDFDPLLDWKFKPICGCEITGMSEEFLNLKHGMLFKKFGCMLWEEMISGSADDLNVIESYELWVLEDMSMVFVYCCAFGISEDEGMMYYRYPLGKKIPTDMELDADTFLNEMWEKIYCARHPD